MTGKVSIYNHKTDSVKAIIDVSILSPNSPDKPKYLQRMYEKGYWAKCDCTSSMAISYPRLANDAYQLVNDPVHGRHSIKCPLYTIVSGERNTSGESVPVVAPEPPKSFTPIKIGGEKKKTDANKPNPGEVTGLKTSKKDKIHSLLAFALVQAKYDVMVFGKVFDLKALFRTKVFKGKVCTNGRNSPLLISDLVFIDPEKDGLNWQEIIEKKRGRFPAHVPLQAYLILLVDNAIYNRQSEVLTLFNNTSETSYSCSKVSHHYESTSGPRIIFIIRAYIDNDWQVSQVYTHPVVSKEIPMLIDSGIERKFVHEVLGYEDVGIRISKYYQHIEHKGHKLLPDFKLTFSRGHYRAEIVEVMGMKGNVEYDDRKHVLIPLMKEKYNLPVSEVNPDSVAEDTALIIETIRTEF